MSVPETSSRVLGLAQLSGSYGWETCELTLCTKDKTSSRVLGSEQVNNFGVGPTLLGWKSSSAKLGKKEVLLPGQVFLYPL